MDQGTLVASGQALVTEMDRADLKPRVAMWVHNSERDTWKLWLVPPPGLTDKHEFYRRISVIANEHGSELGGLDASDTEMISDSHPAITGLKGFIKAEGLTNVRFSGNMFNGFYLPDGIIMRVAL